ncbi:hypothetical protein COL5a_006442 [Colletotrichum fioriniae]|nr:hypothetical protein COL5a_006442 [Colletotrichum fioriniae]
MAALKMTFLFQFYHIFRNVRIMRRVYVGAIVFVAAWTLAQILLQILICLPIEANWDHSVRTAKCLPSVLSTYFNATGTLVTDVIVLFLPLPTLWSLKLNSSQRWAALGVFGIGALVPIMSAGRIWSLTHAPPKGSLSKVFEVFTKEKFLRSSTGGSQGDQSGLNLQNGATSTMVTTSRNHSISMSEGAANFLGEFGILVERTWEVEEIRME